MHDYSVLKVNPITDRNAVDISAQHRTKPYTAIPTDRHFTDYRRRFGHKSTLSDYRSKSSY